MNGDIELMVGIGVEVISTVLLEFGGFVYVGANGVNVVVSLINLEEQATSVIANDIRRRDSFFILLSPSLIRLWITVSG